MTTYRRIGAVTVAVKILRYLADQKQPVNGQEIARAVGEAPDTVRCHLATLEDERLVRSVGGAFELDMGLALFWARKKAQLQGRIDQATDELNQLEREA